MLAKSSSIAPRSLESARVPGPARRSTSARVSSAAARLAINPFVRRGVLDRCRLLGERRLAVAGGAGRSSSRATFVQILIPAKSPLARNFRILSCASRDARRPNHARNTRAYITAASFTITRTQLPRVDPSYWPFWEKGCQKEKSPGRGAGPNTDRDTPTVRGDRWCGLSKFGLTSRTPFLRLPPQCLIQR